MSVQRRRGVPAIVYPSVATKDNRGNVTRVPDMTRPMPVTAALIPQRSSKAEVPGQQQINVVKMLVRADLPGVDLFSRVEAAGKVWDVVSPPAYHHGSRRTRHWSINVRERP